MALSIENEEADRLARRLAQKTGESITDAVFPRCGRGWSESSAGPL